MNLSDFSLLKEAHDHYMVGHPKGQSIKVPKKGLSDKAHQLIGKLKKHQDLAEGTPEGTESDEDTQYQAEQASLPKTAEEETAREDAEDQAQEANQTHFAHPEGPTKLPKQSPSAEAEVAASAALKPEATPQTTTPTVPPTASPYPSMGAGADEALTALRQSQATEQGIGKQVGAAYQQAQQGISELKNPNDLYKSQQISNAAFEKKITDNPIDQDRYLHHMSTGSKIASGIGMILSGIGSGVTGQPNMAVQYLQNAINNDIDAQKYDKSQNMNLWKMNREAYGNEAAANVATQNQLLTIAEVKAKQAMAAAPGAEAQARMAPLIMQLQQQKNMGNWMLSRSQGGPAGTEAQHVNELQIMQQVNPAMYKDMEDKYIPNVGVAAVKPSPQDKEAFISNDILKKNINEAINFATNKAGVLGTFPHTASDLEGNNIRNSILLELNKLHGLNRLTDIEYKNFENSVPHPGTFFNAGALRQLNNLAHQADSKRNSLIQGLRITPFQTAPQDQQALAAAKLNPNDPRSIRAMQLLGQR